ncbi:MAG: HNH endonuclease [Candidatus Tectomicrobia bacterium]|nr:HNH endonuclease [Candidatus Tectomicrobia bacterium]
MTDTQPVTCPLCRRPLVGKVTRHHLYPQKYGRKKGHKAHAKAFPVVSLHKICHHMIHALFSEKYLAERLNTIEALTAHPEMQSFLEFIEDKPPSFDVRVRSSKDKKQRDKPGILP